MTWSISKLWPVTFLHKGKKEKNITCLVTFQSDTAFYTIDTILYYYYIYFIIYYVIYIIYFIYLYYLYYTILYYFVLLGIKGTLLAHRT